MMSGPTWCGLSNAGQGFPGILSLTSDVAGSVEKTILTGDFFFVVRVACLRCSVPVVVVGFLKKYDFRERM